MKVRYCEVRLLSLGIVFRNWRVIIGFWRIMRFRISVRLINWWLIKRICYWNWRELNGRRWIWKWELIFFYVRLKSFWIINKSVLVKKIRFIKMYYENKMIDLMNCIRLCRFFLIGIGKYGICLLVVFLCWKLLDLLWGFLNKVNWRGRG